MEEKERCDDMKLNWLRHDIQAGIASGDAGTLDADEIKRRARARHAAILRDTERQYEAGLLLERFQQGEMASIIRAPMAVLKLK